jgi:hypothetical protein
MIPFPGAELFVASRLTCGHFHDEALDLASVNLGYSLPAEQGHDVMSQPGEGKRGFCASQFDGIVCGPGSPEGILTHSDLERAPLAPQLATRLPR